MHHYDPGQAALADIDARVILELPTDPSKTVWALLNGYERLSLIMKIAEVFQKGKYDERFFDSQNNPVTRALKSSDWGSSGTIPQKLLAAAARGCNAGVCRNTNMAMVGLLGELGIPNSQIRLVTGKSAPDAKSGHIWIEYKLFPDEPWREIDATPNNGQKTGTSDNRSWHPYELREWSDLLTPVIYVDELPPGPGQ